ncbi:MAG: hypothetical protein VXZ63_04145, partial [Planctomycetota bacterium]|nr:hypothetical protein [Planctomycetota bacterium]
EGKLESQLTWDRMVRAQAKRNSGRFLDLDRASYQRKLMANLIGSVVEFHLKESGDSRLLEKVCPYPGTSRIVFANIRRYCPESTMIRLVRDGRDVLVHHALAWLTRDAQGTDRYSYLIERRPDLGLGRFFDDHFIERWALWWSEIVRLGRKIQKIEEPPFLLRYEDLMREPGSGLEQLSSILKFEVPIEAEIKASQFQPRFQGQVLPGWSNFFVRRDGEVFQRVAGDVLEAMNYEVGDRWVDDLPEKLSWPPRCSQGELLEGLPFV